PPLSRPHLLHPPHSTLLPYTTLFRSLVPTGSGATSAHSVVMTWYTASGIPAPLLRVLVRATGLYRIRRRDVPHLAETRAKHILRSEEHTSELQSRENLVCRLLLEKKK